jgi:ribosomal protein S18 acetylase RimI-like enzyme
VIRPLPVELYEEAVGLWQTVGLTRPWNDPRDDLVRAVGGPASAVLAAVEQERLQGTVMVGMDGHRAWMYYLAVTPDRQRQGLGRLLVAAAENWAADHGAPKLMLMVRSANEAVLGFYAALGYEVNQVATLGKMLS